MIESTRESHPTLEEIRWRPGVTKQRPTWRRLSRLTHRNKALRKHLLNQPIIAGSPQFSDPVNNLLWAADEQLMQYCYAKLFHGKTGSVRLVTWLRRRNLPTFGLGWRGDLWHQVLMWEFEKWSWRIYEANDHSFPRSVIALLKTLPLGAGVNDYRLPAVWFRNQYEASLASRWFLIRGEDLFYSREWRSFRKHFPSYFNGYSR